VCAADEVTPFRTWAGVATGPVARGRSSKPRRCALQDLCLMVGLFVVLPVLFLAIVGYLEGVKRREQG
jgi:hypothetical protein